MVALSGLLLAVRLLPEGKGQAVAWQDLSSQVGPLTILGPVHRVFRERSKLERYLRSTGARQPAPTVDFSATQLLIVSPGPRSSTGYSVEVLSVRQRGGRIDVRIKERAPGLRENVRPEVTYPYRLISLPAGKDVYVDWVGR